MLKKRIFALIPYGICGGLMVHKICKIKNLGLVFPNYVWENNLPPFKQFNLVYGWNGSGKTTLSRLFEAINQSAQTMIEGLEYEIEYDNGVKFKQNEIFSQQIRIFNQDYIQNNVKLLECRAKSISVFLGEQNKDLVETILADRLLLAGEGSNPGKVA